MVTLFGFDEKEIVQNAHQIYSSVNGNEIGLDSFLKHI